MSALTGIPVYDMFINLVTSNIGIVPELRLDERGSSHRIQIFREAGVTPRVIFSKRALSRYKSILDMLNYGIAKKSSAALCDGACLLLGRDLLLTSRFVGTAFMTRGFKTIRATGVPEAETFEYMLQALRDVNQAGIITFLHPLAHEIGHFERSQQLAPKAIHSDEFLETYDLCYQAVHHIIGNLDYVSRRGDPGSPLHVSLLREEVIADWFAVRSVFFTLYKTAPAGQFHLLAVMLNLIMFPLVTAFEETCLKEWRSTQAVQEVLLANQCRFSLLIDSMRATAKHLFRNNADDVDEAILVAEQVYHEGLSLIGETALRMNSVKKELFEFTDEETISYLSKETPPAQWPHLHAYLKNVMADAVGYQLPIPNREAFSRLFDSMMVYDTAIVADGVLLALRNDEE